MISSTFIKTKTKMDKIKESLQALGTLLEKIELDVKRARLLINQFVSWDFEISENDLKEFEKLAQKFVNYEEEEVKVIEGIYDGYFMIGSDKNKYPVPLNYASKTKLIPGDALKLRIMKDGRLIYKLIGPAPRKYIKATLTKSDEGKRIAITDEGKTYFLNQAAVTFFKGKPGDELSIIINAENKGSHAAIEALIEKRE